jgi:hypothetical protein
LESCTASVFGSALGDDVNARTVATESVGRLVRENHELEIECHAKDAALTAVRDWIGAVMRGAPLSDPAALLRQVEDALISVDSVQGTGTVGGRQRRTTTT